LAVGSAVKRPLIAENGDIYIGHTMSITLSADHRVIDGAVGATFVASITEYLSNPLKLML
jgi:pyruvate dehydrogenase E2 component (dihydrolipoamide acetyltransferase)